MTPRSKTRRGRSQGWLWLGLLALTLGLAGIAPAARALTMEQAVAIASGDSDERIAALNERVQAADPDLPAFIQALLDDAVKVFESQAYIVDGEQVRLAGSGEAATLPEYAEDVINNNRMRGELQGALAALQLKSADRAERAAAIDALKGNSDESRLALIESALAAESDTELKQALTALRAEIMIGAEDPARRIQAARTLAAAPDPATRSLLLQQLNRESDEQVKLALHSALQEVESGLAWGERLGLLFTGISLGSILLLAALGLAITYGLMGVINMAHGELIMIGAYATYLTQDVFREYLPGAFDWYIVAAIPVAFLTSAAVGAVLEKTIIKWLYGRPLETLLATWGISLVLMQTVRSLFGAQNVAVENPAWLSGGWQVLPNLILPYNRLAILAFAALVLAGVALLISRTRLGLFVRGVTQNRQMASCVGVDTAKVDMMAFALGAGIAGLAGCALSQVGNVGPDLGQGYIVDSFMVVVLGGVGQLAGTVVAGLGLGVLSKLLEDWSGAVLAKIMVLMFIVIFIQKRPQGLFAIKGRSAD